MSFMTEFKNYYFRHKLLSHGFVLFVYSCNQLFFWSNKLFQLLVSRNALSVRFLNLEWYFIVYNYMSKNFMYLDTSKVSRFKLNKLNSISIWREIEKSAYIIFITLITPKYITYVKFNWNLIIKRLNIQSDNNR